jgi:hypothetical protein
VASDQPYMTRAAFIIQRVPNLIGYGDAAAWD